ncbi:Hint domain-containing protein [Thioclava indica]|nr:Hint domain-containing protein [Thioclava indica]
MLDPDWDASSDARTFTFSDDDTALNGDTNSAEVGDDGDQAVIVKDAQGNVIASGQVYSEAYFTFSAPDGTTIYADVLEIGGTVVGVVASAPIQPGVTYSVASIVQTSSPNTAEYSNIVDADYDPDDADSIQGGQYADSLQGGALNDTIDGGSGDDQITTGAGADTLVFSDGDGADSVSDFDMSDDGAGHTVDQFDVSGLTDGNGNPINAWDVTVSKDGGGNAVLSFPNGESIVLKGVSPAQVSTAPQLNAMGIPCFVAGTLIATPAGPRAVETLRCGDLVCTRDGPPMPVLWAGARSLSYDDFLREPRMRPIEFCTQALGNYAPLRLSAQHCVWLPDGSGGALGRAAHMAACRWGGARVMRGVRAVHYSHILLARHALVQAQGAWVESFWPGLFALRALTSAARWELLRVKPELASILYADQAPEVCYGPRVRAVLPKVNIDRDACKDWSRLARDAVQSDDLSGNFCTSSG